jgi:hypothetical protein
MTKDIKSGDIRWNGNGVVNPYNESGELVNLDDFPLLRRYLESNKELLTKRHTAKENQSKWYKTIDKITPSLTTTPKLLIPDIKGDAQIVFDRGQYYPHHNLYYISSENWDLEVLQAILNSGIAKLFVFTYSTKMKGGYMRFQAQYLRRICVPDFNLIPGQIILRIKEAISLKNWDECNEAVYDLYNLTNSERQSIGGS